MDPEDEERIHRDSLRVAIDPMFFGVDDGEVDPDTRAEQLRHAALIGGVLWHASVTLVDKLFEEVATIHAQTPRPLG